MQIKQIKRKLGMTYFYRKRIDRLEERMERYKGQAERITPSYSLTPGGSSSEHSRIETAVLQYLSMEENVRAELNKYIQAVDDNIKLINMVPDVVQRTVLSEHYVFGEKFSDIAISLHYEERQVYRIYNAGLSWLANNVSECQ